MKSLLLLLLAAWSCNALWGQKTAVISDRLPYDAPAGHRLLMTNSGNTYLFTFTAPGHIGIDAYIGGSLSPVHTTYNSHRVHFAGTDAPKCRALFEYQHKIYLYFEVTTDNTRSLVQQVYDPDHGMSTEEHVVDVPLNGVTDQYRVLPYTDGSGYAIISYGRNADGKTEIVLRRYSSDVCYATMTLQPSNDQYPTNALLSADIDAAKNIYVAVGLKTAKIRDSALAVHYRRQLLIATAKDGATTCSQHTIPLSESGYPDYNQGYPFIADCCVDTATGRLNYLMLDSKIGHDVMFYPQWLAIGAANGSYTMCSVGDSFAVTNKPVKRAFQAVPTHLFCQGDTTLIVYRRFLKNSHSDVVIAGYDTAGNSLFRHKAPAPQRTQNTFPDDLLHHRPHTASTTHEPTEYYTQQCFEDRGYYYVFYNTDENSRLPLPGAKGSTTHCLSYQTDHITHKHHLFGHLPPNHRLMAYMGVTCYNAACHTYAMLVQENSWFKTFYRVVWLPLGQ